MKESFRKIAPIMGIASVSAAAGIAMFYDHKFNKPSGIDINERRPITSTYICPPFGGKCKSFDTEEHKSTFGNRR